MKKNVFTKINKQNTELILNFLNTDDYLQLVKVNSTFNKNKDLVDTYHLFKTLVNEIEKNKLFNNPVQLLSNDLKYLKVLLKKQDLIYNETKIHILANVAGFIHGKVMKLLADSNLEFADSQGTKFNQILRRFVEFLLQPENNSEVLIKSNTSSKPSSNSDKTDNKTARSQLSNQTISFTKLEENTSNLVRYLLTHEKGSLYLSNKGVSINSLQAVVKSISVFSNVVRLVMNGNDTESISGKEFQLNNSSHSLYNNLFKALSYSTLLKSINLAENKLTTKHIKPLFVYLASKPYLNSIDLSKNLISGSYFEVITSFLKTNKSLINLDLSGNILGHAGAKFIAEGLIQNETLKKLDISFNGLCSEGVDYISEVLAKIKLTSLNLAGNYIQDNAIEKMSKGLKGNKTLSYFFIDENNFSDKYFDALSKSLTALSSLVSLDLKKNKLTDKSCDNLFDNFIVNKSQANSLELSNNLLTNKCLDKLNLIFLTYKENLIGRINLESNNLGSKGGELLNSIISNAKSLKNLNLADNKLKESIKVFYSAIKDSKTLKILDLSKNELGDQTKYLAEIFKGNGSIKTANLSFNYISDNGLVEIAEGMKVNTCLINLDMRINKISSEGFNRAQEVLKNNRFRKKIDYSDSLFIIPELKKPEKNIKERERKNRSLNYNK